MKQRKGPYPSPGSPKQWAANILPPLVAVVSGELTANHTGVPMGSVGLPGRVSDVWLSVGGSGKDDGHALSVTADVLINGTTCLTTKPIIAHVSGEAAQQKTTKTRTDTGVTQSAVSSANSVAQGDVISYSLTLARTATPTTEINNVAVVVEFEPSF
jgi:hypothetical protein